jgi:Magnesium transporter NIPA
LGAAALYSISNWETDNQFKRWEFYPLLFFVVFIAIFEVIYLNKALALFSATIVTPLNYVFFSTATLITTAVLYNGFNVESAVDAMTIIMGFFVIVIGVALLFQYNLKMSKLNLTARHIEDINDHDVIEYRPEDDDPFKMMSEIFPLNGVRVHPLKNKYLSHHSMASKTMDETSPEAYTRPEDPKQEITGKLMTLPIPQFSLSEQIQNRAEMDQRAAVLETRIEVDPPSPKGTTFGSLLGLRLGFGSLAKLSVSGSSRQEIKDDNKAKSGSNMSFMKGDLTKGTSGASLVKSSIAKPGTRKKKLSSKWSLSRESLAGSILDSENLQSKMSSSAHSIEDVSRIPVRSSPVPGPSNLRNAVVAKQRFTDENSLKAEDSDGLLDHASQELK